MHLLNNRLGRLTALIALGGAALYSQGTQTANVTGLVVDAAGAPLAGVTVRLTSPALQGVRTYVTDANGKFIARLLPPGLYSIQYTKDGLETRKITEQLGIDQTFTPKVTLTKVGGAVVEVVAAAPAVDKTDVKTATNYRADAVDMLPNARTQEGVALLTPGVTVGVGGRVQIRGAMTSGNLYLLDGQNIADNAYNNRGVALIDDSIEETQVITGAMSAEYGDVEGGIINSITRSGGNEFSGSLRWELSDPSWNATQPFTNRTAVQNVLGETKTLQLSGPILKDRLWFAASYFTTKSDVFGTIGEGSSGTSANLTPGANGNGSRGVPIANGPEGLGAGYTRHNNEIRRQAKLTWSINQDHTLVASYMKNAVNQTNRNYYAGELEALVPQVSVSDFLNIALRSAWSSNFTTELRFGKKHQNLSAGGAANGQSPIYSMESGGFYNNGIFNSADGGDNRDNRTLNLKASLFWNAAGSHQTDFGIDYYKGIRRARNDQSPTGYIFDAYGAVLVDTTLPATNPLGAITIPGRTAIPYVMETYISKAGEASNFSTGLYVNDKWSIDQHWNLQVGLRFDSYKAENESGSKTAGANGLSPRLGLKYDLFGDSKHIFGLSYARYNAKVLEGITNSVTGQGNPTEIDYLATTYAAHGRTNADRISFAALQNPALYTVMVGYNDPSLNVKLNDKMKAPTVDEVQGSYALTYNVAGLGEGFVKVTGVYKNWKNLIDVTVGNSGHVISPAGDDLYVKVWDNNPDATRKYKGLELEGQLNRNGWTIGGNITWSSLKGNYEGEGSSTPARGESINSWNVTDGVAMFDKNDLHPEGYLSGHVATRMRFNASKTFINEFGKSTVGWVYRFDTGSHFSYTRSLDVSQLNPGLPDQAGTSFTQYKDQQRGQGVLPGAAYLDLALTHDFPLFKVSGKDVTAFGKLYISNVLNHQQIINYSASYNAAAGSYGVANQGLNSPWIPLSTYGTVPASSSYYGSARTITASAGFRF
ncbi:TonB-dependent receptor [Geothrix oryzisoli]|uniref:TonB-dependent receptor n=1 Tax=Geothrix oryzisoli TaxID=2922721 RepID=UPI001FABB332|nr:TonB-dependent receptor [Geothrix oryzisoli]